MSELDWRPVSDGLMAWKYRYLRVGGERRVGAVSGLIGLLVFWLLV